MPPTGPTWLDDGDKISSIVSAIISILSLLITIYQGRHSSLSAGQPATRRRWRPVVAGICAAIATGSAASVAWAPHAFRTVSLVVGGAACLAALAVVGSGLRVWLRSLKKLDPAVRRLLDAQRSEADYHQYAFGSLPLPGVSLIYVEQHLGTVHSRQKATRILDADVFVRSSPKAIVIGAPGAGKSTLAAHTVGTAALWWTQARVASRTRTAPFGGLLPVFIPAKALSDNDVPNALAARWSQASVNADIFTRPPYRNADWLIIVDSLDEISAGETRSRVIQKLGNFIASDTKSHLIITTRALTSGELADLTSRGAQEFYLRLFGPDELERFATKWFNARGGGHVDAIGEAARFMSHLRSSALMSIARVPLLATMAVLVYESDRDRTLPTSRAGLYHEFIYLLRGAREANPSTPFEAWLTDNLDNLLRELASAHVREDTLRLLPRAIAWIATNAPAESLAGSDAEQLGVLRNALIGSGLCVFAPSLDSDGGELESSHDPDSKHLGNDVEFVHFTIAEYLAADPSAHAFSYDNFRSLMANGRSRGFALFALARSSVDPSQTVSSLLQDDDALSAGRIVADGIPVDTDIRRHTIDALVSRVTQDHSTVIDCVSLLADLAHAPDVWARLQALVVDASQTLWVRAAVADALADLDTASGLSLLQTLVNGSVGSDSDAIWWAKQRLAARIGSIVPPEDVADRRVLNPRSLGEIGRRSYIDIAIDRHQLPAVRVQAARVLHQAGDQTGTVVLHELVGDPNLGADLRLQVARTLTASRDTHGVEALRTLALIDGNAVTRIPVEIRRSAANDLMSAGDPAGTEALRQIARDFELSSNERRQVVAQLVERDDPLGRDMLAQLDRRQRRRSTAMQLIGATLSIAALIAVADGALASGRTLPITGAACVVTVAAWYLADSLGLLAVTSAQRTSRRQRRTYGRSRTARGVEYLAKAEFEHLTDIQRASLDQVLDVHLANYGQPNGHAADLHPNELKRLIQSIPSHSIVILGPPGSGKTHAATTLALDLIRERSKGDAVPVLLSMRNWSASDRDLEDWMIDRLAQDYVMPQNEVAELVSARQILPVLDGLDEVDPDQQQNAVRAIDDMTHRGVACVVTCRTGDYERIVNRIGPLGRTAVVEMLPVRPQDVVKFIVDSVTDDQRKAWTPIIRELELETPGPFAELMSSPLTVMIALRSYLTTGRNPGSLLRQVHTRERPSADLVNLLLEDFVPNALSETNGYGRGKSMRWLRTIAQQMKEQGANQFSWWNVRGWLPRQAMPVAALVAIAVPPLIATIVCLVIGTVQLPTILAATTMVLGLVVISSRVIGPAATNGRLNRSSGFATAVAVVQAGTFAVGGATLGYAGTHQFSSALILGIAAAGSFWATDAGRFHISRGYLALNGRLPWSLSRFLDATTRAGVTTFDGAAYRFVHILMQEFFAREI